MDMYTSINVEVRKTSSIFLQALAMFYIWQGLSLSWKSSNRRGWLIREPGICLSLPPHFWIRSKHHHTQLVLQWFWESNSYPHSYKSGDLPTDLCIQPDKTWLSYITVSNLFRRKQQKYPKFDLLVNTV